MDCCLARPRGRFSPVTALEINPCRGTNCGHALHLIRWCWWPRCGRQRLRRERSCWRAVLQSCSCAVRPHGDPGTLRAQVFCSTGDQAHEEMRSACFDYLRLGGVYSSGPISLLSGLNPRPSVLVMHFFMVLPFRAPPLLPLSERAWCQQAAVCEHPVQADGTPAKPGARGFPLFSSSSRAQRSLFNLTSWLCRWQCLALGGCCGRDRPAGGFGWGCCYCGGPPPSSCPLFALKACALCLRPGCCEGPRALRTTSLAPAAAWPWRVLSNLGEVSCRFSCFCHVVWLADGYRIVGGLCTVIPIVRP